MQNNELVPDKDQIVVICSNCGKAWLQNKQCLQVMFNPPLCTKCATEQNSQSKEWYNQRTINAD